MRDLDTILPMQGFGDIRFAMSRHQVRAKLGEPDREYERDTGEAGPDIEWLYSKKELAFSFSFVDAHKLGSITVRSRCATLFDIRPIGMEMVSVLTTVASRPELLAVASVVWPASNPQNYVCDALGLRIHATAGEVSRVCIERLNLP